MARNGESRARLARALDARPRSARSDTHVPRAQPLTLLAAVAVAFAAAVVPGAAAKDFKPGDLRVCGAKRCVVVMNRQALKRLGAFIYAGAQPPSTSAAPMGARAYQLRFSNGYVAGIVAGKALDRWLSYGVYLERFTRNTWYRVPPATAADLRTLVNGLMPLRVTPAAVARSR